MNALARPRGPLPARVYWFRRTLLVGALLALVFGAAQLVPAGDPGGESARVVAAEPERTPDAAPRSTADADPLPVEQPRVEQPVPDEQAKKKAKKDKSAKPTKTPLPEPTGRCESGEIVVTPKLRGEAHAGSRVRFTLLLTTVSTPACTWKVAPRTLVVKLTSGDDRIWSSQDCQAAIPRKAVVVRKDHPAKVFIGWRGQRSDSTCSRTTAWAQPGWYHIKAAAFGAEPADLQFELKKPVPPTITPEPEPKKDRDKNEKQDQKQG